MRGRVHDGTLIEVTGLEILAVIVLLVGSGAGSLALTALLSERRKRAFVELVGLQLEAHVDHVESGDINKPLAFNIGAVRVQAAVRGDVEVWQLERRREGAAAGGDEAARSRCPFAVVHREWRAPDADAIGARIGDVTPRLCFHAKGDAAGFLSRARAQLANVLGRHARRCVVEEGRVFLEVTRRGLAVEELADAVMRLEALATVAGGGDALLRLPASDKDAAVAGPHGMPVPALTG